MARKNPDEVTFKVNLDTEDLMQKLVNYDLAHPTVLSMKRVSPTVKSPIYGTKKSARFDLHVALDHVEQVKGWDNQNIELLDLLVKDGELVIPAHSRVLVPTGFIFGIPEGNELTIVPRSSTALKFGLFKANSVAVIDEDFQHETHLMLYNANKVPVTIKHNDRLGQAKVSPVIRVEFLEVEELDEVDSDRVGGWGSTGN